VGRLVDRKPRAAVFGCVDPGEVVVVGSWAGASVREDGDSGQVRVSATVTGHWWSITVAHET